MDSKKCSKCDGRGWTCPSSDEALAVEAHPCFELELACADCLCKVDCPLCKVEKEHHNDKESLDRTHKCTYGKPCSYWDIDNCGGCGSVSSCDYCIDLSRGETG